MFWNLLSQSYLLLLLSRLYEIVINFLNDFIMLIQNIYCFNVHEFFVAFFCANIIGSLVNSLFAVNIFNPVLVSCLLVLFHKFNFIRPAIVSSCSSSPSSAGIGGKPSSIELILNILGLFRTVIIFFESSGSLLY